MLVAKQGGDEYILAGPGVATTSTSSTSKDSSGLSEWKSYIENNTVYVKLDSASSNRGSLKKGETYILKYSKVGNTENFEVTGIVSYSGNTATSTYSNAKLQDYQLSLWGRKYRFDADGNVWDIHLAEEELAGKLLRSSPTMKKLPVIYD